MGLVPAASGAILFEENFETATTGWGIGNYPGGSVSFAEAGGGAAFPTRSLRLAHAANSTAQLVASMTVGEFNIPRTSTEPHRFEFEFRISALGGTGIIIFSDSERANQYPMMIQINPNGSVTAAYWDGSANNVVTLLDTLSIETTYTVQLTSTPADGTYSAVISDGTGEFVGREFRHIQSNGADRFTKFDSLSFFNNGGSSVDFDLYIDNIRVSTIPEPGTVALIGVPLAFLAFCPRILKRTWSVALVSMLAPAAVYAHEDRVSNLAEEDFAVFWKAERGMPAPATWGNNGIGEPRMEAGTLIFDSGDRLGDCFLRHKLPRDFAATGTLEFRARVEAQRQDGATAGGVSVHLRGKSYVVQLQAEGVRLNLEPPVSLETHEFHTYRLVIQESGALLFLNDEKEPRAEVAGMEDDAGRPAVSFGVLGKRAGGRTEWKHVGFSPVLYQP